MDADQLIQLGRLNRSHGLKGGIKATINEVYVNQFKTLTHIFIQKGEDFLPFFISRIEGWQQNHCIVYFDDIDTREGAESTQHNNIFAIRENIEIIEEVNDLGHWLNTMVTMSNGQILGEVVGITELPQQIILQIETIKGVLPVPITEEFIIDYNSEEKTLVLELPEGYMDIFL